MKVEKITGWEAEELKAEIEENMDEGNTIRYRS